MTKLRLIPLVVMLLGTLAVAQSHLTDPGTSNPGVDHRLDASADDRKVLDDNAAVATNGDLTIGANSVVSGDDSVVIFSSDNHLSVEADANTLPQIVASLHAYNLRAHRGLRVSNPGLFQVGAGHSVGLSWTGGVCPSGQTCGATTGYSVLRAAASAGPFTSVGTTTAAVLTFTDSSTAVQAEGSTFFYEVEATNTAGNSPPSNVVSATIPVSAPGVAPTLNPPVVK